MRTAKRIDNLPPYLFAEIDRKKALKTAQGIDVISLGIGDPDTPTPDHIVEAMIEATKNPANHQYPSYVGAPRYREACSRVDEAPLRRRRRPEHRGARAHRQQGGHRAPLHRRSSTPASTRSSPASATPSTTPAASWSAARPGGCR